MRKVLKRPLFYHVLADIVLIGSNLIELKVMFSNVLKYSAIGIVVIAASM